MKKLFWKKNSLKHLRIVGYLRLKFDWPANISFKIISIFDRTRDSKFLNCSTHIRPTAIQTGWASQTTIKISNSNQLIVQFLLYREYMILLFTHMIWEQIYPSLFLTLDNLAITIMRNITNDFADINSICRMRIYNYNYENFFLLILKFCVVNSENFKNWKSEMYVMEEFSFYRL